MSTKHLPLKYENYSPKSIVIRPLNPDDRMLYNHKLSLIGCKWNPRLKKGDPGWILSIKKKDKFLEYIENICDYPEEEVLTNVNSDKNKIINKQNNEISKIKNIGLTQDNNSIQTDYDSVQDDSVQDQSVQDDSVQDNSVQDNYSQQENIDNSIPDYNSVKSDSDSVKSYSENCIDSVRRGSVKSNSDTCLDSVRGDSVKSDYDSVKSGYDSPEYKIKQSSQYIDLPQDKSNSIPQTRPKTSLHGLPLKNISACVDASVLPQNTEIISKRNFSSHLVEAKHKAQHDKQEYPDRRTSNDNYISTRAKKQNKNLTGKKVSIIKDFHLSKKKSNNCGISIHSSKSKNNSISYSPIINSENQLIYSEKKIKGGKYTEFPKKSKNDQISTRLSLHGNKVTYPDTTRKNTLISQDKSNNKTKFNIPRLSLYSKSNNLTDFKHQHSDLYYDNSGNQKYAKQSETDFEDNSKILLQQIDKNICTFDDLYQHNNFDEISDDSLYYSDDTEGSYDTDSNYNESGYEHYPDNVSDKVIDKDTQFRKALLLMENRIKSLEKNNKY